MTSRAAVSWAVNALIVLAVLVGSMAALSLAAQASASNALVKIQEANDQGQLWTEEYPIISAFGLPITYVDAFSECVAWGQALSTSPLPFADRPKGRTATKDGACQEFQEVLDGPSGITDYSRFFHGASAIMRLGVTHVDVATLRIATSVGLVLSAALITVAGFRRSTTLGIGLAAFFFLLTDTLYQGLSLTIGISTVFALVGVLVTMVVARRWPRFVWASAASSGVLYAVVAQLFVPMEFAILTGIMVMSPALAMPAQRRMYLRMGAEASLAWAVGYTIAMVGRFIWAAIVLGGSPATSEASAAFESRITSSVVQPFRAVLVDLIGGTLLEWRLRTVGLIVVVALIAWTIGSAGRVNLGRREIAVCLTPSILAAGWLLVMGGHDSHPWVSLVVAAIALNLLFVTTLNRSAGRAVRTDHTGGAIL